MLSIDTKDVDHFTALNNDCILEILKYLSLDDLGAVSVTCEKLQQLGGEHFQKKYPELVSSAITIKDSNGVIGFENSENYKRYFSRLFENVKILFWKVGMGDRLLEFLRINCCKTIKKIEFDCSKWSVAFAEGIADFLGSVETISFVLTPNYVFCFDDILNCSSHLKNLKIVCCTDRLKFPIANCPKLETFEFEGSLPPIQHFTKFLEINPTIRRVTWRQIRFNIDLVKRFLIMIAESQVEELLFDWNANCSNESAQSIQNELGLLNMRSTFKRFELYLLSASNTVINFVELAHLKSFSGFHLNSIYPHHSDPHVSAFNSFINLTTLSIDGNVSEMLAVNLSQHLVNLKTLNLYRTYSNVKEVYSIESQIAAFVRNTPKLAEIFIPFRKNVMLDVSKLNMDRAMLKGATKLIIHLRQDVAKNFDVATYEFVNIKRIKIIKFEKPNVPFPLLLMGNY